MCNNNTKIKMVWVFMKRIHLQKKSQAHPPRQEIGSQGMGGGKQVETTKPFLIIHYE
jgi:hypothetical protein